MNNRIIFAALGALSVLSCSPRIIQVPVRDTLTVTRTEVLRDTVVQFVLPEESAANTTRDTVSHLETKYAESDAAVSEGILRHTLKNKPTEIETKIVYRDKVTTEYKVREIPVTVEVPKAYTPRWVWWVLGWAVLATALIALRIYFRFR